MRSRLALSLDPLPRDPSLAEAESRIERRARLAGLRVDAPLLARLGGYLSLLYHWNRRINLTSLDDPDKAVDRLIVEPLMAAPSVPENAKSLIDIGSGGGSPAIPLKLALPHLRLVMVEGRVRKAAFLQEASRQLGLTGVDVERVRFEALAERRDLTGCMDVVTVRAIRVGSRELLLLHTLLRPGGLLLWFRSRSEEPPATTLLEVAGEHLLVPALDSRLLLLRRPA